MIYNTYLEIIRIMGFWRQILTSGTDLGKSTWGMPLLWSQSKMTNLMERVSKAALLPVRRMAYQWKFTKLYYWSERKLDDLRAVDVMPFWYYRRLYRTCMWLVAIRQFQRIADWGIHTIPYHVRFEVA